MDLVYIVKKGDRNEDLRYSLRSIAKFVPHDNIWIIGYKPSWVTNVRYIPVEQKQDKWKNSVNNIIEACKCKNISENFVLMNDDFFAIKEINDLTKSLNLCMNVLDARIQRYKHSSRHWDMGFKHLKDLLKNLKIQEPYYDFELHIPFIINKEEYLQVMNLSKVQQFMRTSKVLHKRSLYRNIFKHETPAMLLNDVKICSNKDDTNFKSSICDWLSVGDDIVGNSKFKDLNDLLKNLFPEPCGFEDPKAISNLNTNAINKPKPIEPLRIKKPRFGSKKHP